MGNTTKSMIIYFILQKVYDFNIKVGYCKFYKEDILKISSKKFFVKISFTISQRKKLSYLVFLITYFF